MKIGIRPFSASDAEALHQAVLESVEHVSAWLPWCTPDYSIEDARQWASGAVKSWNGGTDYRFVIEDTDTASFLGSVGINHVSQHRVGNFGYWVRKTALNQGVCTTGGRLAIRFAFDKLGFQRLEIQVPIDNHASNAVAAKLGGVYEGIFRNKLILKGLSSPAMCYSIVPSDYAH